MPLRSEFHVNRFGFSEIPDEYIYRMKIQNIPPYVFLMYRCIISLYFIGTGLLSICDMWQTKWLIYLTTWSWMISTIYYLTITTVSGYYWWKLCNYGNMVDSHFRIRIPSSLRVATWLLFDVSLGISLLVTLMFWGFVVVPDNFKTSLVTYITYNEHLLNLLLLIVDYTFHCIPIRVYHALYPILFGCMYLVFSAIYYSTTGDVIYVILDWRNNADSAIVYTVVSMSLLIVGQIFFFFIDKLKVRCCSRRPIENEDDDIVSV